MSGFYDAECPKCRAAIGWYGTMVNRPPCRKCGHTIPRAELEEDDRRIDAYMEKCRQERDAREDKEWADDQPDATKHYAEGQVAFATTKNAARLMPLDIPSPYVATKTPDRKFWEKPHRWWLRGWYDAKAGGSRLLPPSGKGGSL